MAASGGLIGVGSPEARVLAGTSPAVLALHGFGGTPLEVDLALDAARSLGLAARAPLLTGHGRHVRELAGTRFEDWLSAALSDYQALRRDHSQVILVGLSMGSLLATEICLRHPTEVAGLALLANAFWLRAPFPAHALWATYRLGLPDVHLPKTAADIQEPQARQNHLTLSAQPARAAADVWHHGGRLREQLGQVRCPAYLAHGVLDRVCPFRNLARVRARLGSTHVQTRACARSGHIVTRDYDSDLVYADLVQFFTERRSSRAA